MILSFILKSINIAYYKRSSKLKLQQYVQFELKVVAYTESYVNSSVQPCASACRKGVMGHSLN